MPEFHVDIRGICCHVHKSDNTIRTILVDADTHPVHPHYAHLEVQAGGVEDAGGLSALANLSSYDRDGTIWQAYQLAGHRISFAGVIDSGPPHKQPAFENFVPHLQKVCPTFGATRISQFEEDVPTVPVAAHIDIHTGTLDMRTSSVDVVKFVPQHDDPPLRPGLPRRLATGVRLTFELPTDMRPVINITRFGEQHSTEFRLKSWVNRIGIGNLSEDGIRGFLELDPKHFTIYYEMADQPTACSAIPITVELPPGKGLGGGCTNSQYP